MWVSEIKEPSCSPYHVTCFSFVSRIFYFEQSSKLCKGIFMGNLWCHFCGNSTSVEWRTNAERIRFNLCDNISCVSWLNLIRTRIGKIYRCVCQNILSGLKSVYFEDLWCFVSFVTPSCLDETKQPSALVLHVKFRFLYSFFRFKSLFT